MNRVIKICHQLQNRFQQHKLRIARKTRGLMKDAESEMREENNKVVERSKVGRERRRRTRGTRRTFLRHRFRSLIYHLFIQTVITYTSGESEACAPDVSEMTNSGTPQGNW